MARIEAFTVNGESLGEVQQDSIEEKEGPFVGLETTNPSGISTVVLDYGEEENAEQISCLRIEFLEERTFKTYLAQIGDGKTGQLVFQTIIQIQNLFGQEIEATLRLFDQAGNPLILTLDGESGAEFELTLPYLTMRHLETKGVNEQVSVGYACIESDLPIVAQAIYRVADTTGAAFSEAGVQSDGGKIIHVLSVERDVDTGLDSGIALVNVGDAETSVFVSLIALSGETPEEVQNAPPVVILLQSGGHKALFLSELFAPLADGKFRGSLKIISKEPTAVTSLRTINGILVSSVPVGSTQD